MKKTILVLLLNPMTALAWGRHGHHIVGETAAILASQDTGVKELRSHSYDMGYYANIPDFIWKRPATYEFERPQHYMDLEIFERAFAKKPEVKNPLQLSRKDFEAQFPEVKEDAGRAFWRVRELESQLSKVSEELRKLEEPKGKARQALQEKWIVLAGTLGHYVGDLSMPLHVTENHDGQMTGQKGIHSYFEDSCVDEAFPRVQSKASDLAKARWPEFKKKNSGKSVLEMLTTLAESSKKAQKELLATDKRSSRDNVKATCAKFEPMIADRLAQSSVVLAEIYRRNLGWKFDNDRFFFFAGEPEYIRPGEPAPEQTKQ